MKSLGKQNRNQYQGLAASECCQRCRTAIDTKCSDEHPVQTKRQRFAIRSLDGKFNARRQNGAQVSILADIVGSMFDGRCHALGNQHYCRLSSFRS